MISYLKGIILQKTESYIILLQGHIGYQIFTTPEILEHPLGAEVELYIHHKVSAESQSLFGVPDFTSLKFFELLLEVKGVGPKAALTIISAGKIELLQQAILNGDSAIFTRMSGVGKKTADRIILELKNKISGGVLESASTGSSDLFDALISLGYNPREVRAVVSKVDGNLDTASQIKEALKLISSS